MNLEICSIQEQTSDDKKAGRVKIIMSAYEIYETGNQEQHNKNGLHWEEQYTLDNIDSAIGAPFVVRFIDDERTIISDHGRMENDMEDGNIIFPDSDSVGHIEKAWIEERIIDGLPRKVLMVQGVLYDQRYHGLVKNLRYVLQNGGHVKGSVEISGKGDSKQIVYEHGIGSRDENGNLVFPRTPVSYDISGLAILSDFVSPADNASEVIEINTQSTDSKSDDINEKKKEETEMAETVKDNGIVELNEKIVAQVEELNELKNKLSTTEAELNACKEELASAKEKEVELNELLVEANKNLEAQKAQVAELNTEIEPLRKMQADAEKEKAQSEVNEYYENIKKENGFSEAELNSLKTDFVDKCDLKGLKAKEAELCVEKFKAMKTAEKASAELNSVDTSNEESLFFSTKVETVETNSADDGSDLFK